MKDQRKAELKVGIAVVIGIILFIWILTWAKTFSLSTTEKSILVSFKNVSGLEIGDEVSINGVKKGFVDDFKIGGDALVDPGDPMAALELAAAHRLAPRWILHTHGHADHSGGSAALREQLGARVLGHRADSAWFPPDQDLSGEGEIVLGTLRVRVLAVPGHTPGSLLLLWRGRLLTGDTLFWGGCGNCRHGGDAGRLAESFAGPIAGLDGALEVHPGHDYAEANLPFVLDLEPGNAAASARLAAVRAARAAGAEPEPTTLEGGAGGEPVPARPGRPGSGRRSAGGASSSWTGSSANSLTSGS